MTEILRPTFVSQVGADMSAHMRQLAFMRRIPITEMSQQSNVPYPRFRYWMHNPGVVPNGDDFAKLVAYFMPEYKVMPAVVVPVAAAPSVEPTAQVA
ncbi:hypothetical protein [Mesorhizobium sp. M0037]|uniref:hypothetical protein n=1 Tax=unclassified Mesorhizobium TaxID=325217 RepID=UPI0033367E36